MTTAPEILASATRSSLPGLPESASITTSALPGGGSDRRYWRLTLGAPSPRRSVILMEYTDARPDNLCFIPAADILSAHGVAIPEVLAHDPGSQRVWLEDLGNLHLWDYRDDDWTTRAPLYKSTLLELTKIHRVSEQELSRETLSDLQTGFDEELYAWEQSYFVHQFLARFSNLPAIGHEALLTDPQLQALQRFLADQPRTLIHRDFQSQNVLIRDDRAILIDFQGLRPGRPEYDVASILYDPYAPLSEDERIQMVDFYLGVCDNTTDETLFQKNLTGCACQRLMQALGAYAFLSGELGKTRFLEYIPNALENLRLVIQKDENLGSLATFLAPETLDLP